MTFSGGLIDFLFLGVLPNKTPWYLVILVGIGFFIIEMNGEEHTLMYILSPQK
mgnify:CR=1 FL=1